MKDENDFMLTEYQQIANAYFDLSQRSDSMFKFYLTIIAIPIPLLAALISVKGPVILPMPGELPELLALAMTAAGAAGFAMSIVIAEIRFEAILYAKTINRVRDFFSAKSSRTIDPFLVLPKTSKYPTYYEGPRMRGWSLSVDMIFWEIALMALINSFFIALGATNISWLMTIFPVRRLYWGAAVAICCFVIHILAYAARAHCRDNQWTNT